MNLVLIVIPILSILMFYLGLTLKLSDFKEVVKERKALITGLLGQIILLPCVAFCVAEILHLDYIFYLGVVLIACCPGGSSSNVFSKIAGGNVALSITLTALSSIITIVTIPIILSICTIRFEESGNSALKLPTLNLFIQNIVLVFVPIILGYLTQKFCPKAAKGLDAILSKFSFAALMLLAAIFFIQHRNTIADNFPKIGGAVSLLMIGCLILSHLIATILKIKNRERKTICIEVGMQNAAQAIAIASSPFIYNNSQIAVPAIIYALVMNIVLLIYTMLAKRNILR